VVTYDKIDVQEEADVKHKIRRSGYNQAPHINDPRRIIAVNNEQWNNGVPHADSAQYTHRRQYVFVLQEQRPTHVNRLIATFDANKSALMKIARASGSKFNPG
jgi:hypothetical protein